MMTLYCARGSCSAASRITLEETGAPYRSCDLDFSIGEQRSERYLRINPKGKVPVLDVDGAIITENVAIQYYLAHRFPEKRLCPQDDAGHIRWLSLISWISNTVHPDARHISRPENYCDDPATHEAIRDKGRRTLGRWLGEFDGMLAAGRWMMGEQYTTADPYALVFVGVGMGRGVPVSGFPNIVRWKREMLERPAVRKVFEAEASIILADD